MALVDLFTPFAKVKRQAEAREAGRDLGAEASHNVADVITRLRARGAAHEKMAYQAGLGNAADRGVATGTGPGGISGLAQQEIDPRIADVQAQTEEDVLGTISEERRRLEEKRMREEAARPKGLFANLFS